MDGSFFVNEGNNYRWLVGEINTLRGNKKWMKARQGLMKCSALGLPREVVEKVSAAQFPWWCLNRITVA